MYCCCTDDTSSVLWYQSFQLVLSMSSFESPIYPYVEGIVIKPLLHCNGEVLYFLVFQTFAKHKIMVGVCRFSLLLKFLREIRQLICLSSCLRFFDG